MVKSASSFSNLERWELERPDFATFFKDKPRDSLNFLKFFHISFQSPPKLLIREISSQILKILYHIRKRKEVFTMNKKALFSLLFVILEGIIVIGVGQPNDKEIRQETLKIKNSLELRHYKR